MAKRKQNESKILFRTGTRIGFAAAEDDGEYLRECYIDIGQLSQALNTSDPGSIILGRTGCGKSAALINIKENEEHVIEIHPDELALNYISNSNILSFFHGIGVDLDLFFQLLWRHVFCVTLLNYHYNVRSKTESERMIGIIKSLFGSDESKKHALSYLEQWGSTFWEETQERIREIVEHFEGELKAGVDLSALGVPINASGSTSLSTEKKSEITNSAEKVVNKIQVRHLSTMMDIMANDIFNDKQKKYYILIDRLDEKWVHDELRYRLIRALIETVKACRKLRSVKILIALRVDLIERVYKYTRSSGFQEEKYEDFNIRIKWSHEKLFDLANSRIKTLFRRQYTKENVGFYDIFPERYRQSGPTFDHIINRTQYRPRDVIAFINAILTEAAGKTKIDPNVIDDAEREYSKSRLNALCVEWQDEHPHLDLMLEIFRNMPSRLDMSELTDGILYDFVIKICERASSPDGIVEMVESYIADPTNISSVRSKVVSILYKVGALGLRAGLGDIVYFSYQRDFVMRIEDLADDTRLSVSPMLWTALGIRRGRHKGEFA